MRGRVVFVGALLVGLGVVGASAGAQEVSLVYVAAEGCPNEAWLRAEVAARLGRDPFVDDRTAGDDRTGTDDRSERGGSAALVARVSSERAQQRWRGSLELLRVEPPDSLGRRELDDDDCRELSAALALSLAMTLDAIANDVGRGSGGATNANVNTERATTAPRELVLRFEVAEEDAPPSPSRVASHGGDDSTSSARSTPRSLQVVARGGLTLGLRPALAPRIELGLALRRASFVLELGGAFGPPTRGDVAGRSLRTQDGELQLAPCLRAFEVWDVCGLVSLGRLAAATTDDRSPRTWTASLGVRTEVAWPLGRAATQVALTFALDVRASLRRPSVVSGDETLWRAAPVRGVFVVGLRWRFAAWTDSPGHAQAPPRRADDADGRRVERARTGAPWTTRSGT